MAKFLESFKSETALQKLTKKYFEKKSRKNSELVVTFPCATIGQLSSLVVVVVEEELFFMKLL